VCDPIQIGGDVVVSVRGRKSHPVPLTKFRGTFDYTLRGRGSLTKRVSVTFEFLADVRTNRVSVDETPQWRLPRPIFAINTTGGTFEASGEYRDSGGNLIATWAGSGSLPLLPPGSTSNGVTVSGLIDKTGTQSSIDVDVSAPYTVNGTASTFWVEYGVGSLLTQMTDSFVIPGATYTGGGGTESATATFSDVTSTFAPTGNTVR
jgi:hypothetical protein